MDKDIANKEEMHFAADIVALDDQDYSDEIMEETLFEVPENEHEIKTFMHETWKNISMETAVYYWTEEEEYMDDNDNEDNEDYPVEIEDMDNYPDEIEDMDDYPDEIEDMDNFLDEIWKKTVTETEIYFWPIDFGKYKFRPTLETIPEEDEEEDGFEGDNGDSQDIGYSEMDTDTESRYDNISEMEDQDYTDDYDTEDNEEYPDEMEDMDNYPDEMEDMDNYPDDLEDIDNYLDEMEDTDDLLDEIEDIDDFLDEIEDMDAFLDEIYSLSRWKKTVMETEIYFWPMDFGKLTSLPALETIPEEDEEEDGFEGYNGDSQDIGHSEMDTDKESGYDNISEWKKTVTETEIYFRPIDFGKLTSLPTLETIPEEDEEEDGFEDYNGDSQDIGHCEMDTDKESGYDNISGANNYYSRLCNYPDEMEDISNYPDEMEDIYNYPDEIEDMDNYPDEMEAMDDFLDEIWKKTVTETEIYFRPIDFGDFTFRTTLETILEEEEKVIEEGDEERQNMGRVKMKAKADKDELENASRGYRQWRRLLRFFRETFSCCSIQTSE
ncbi:uncharacterized protein LOC142296146 [Anomaloglossus baeobatrachus]|uniref:uncharacterized protein LOC142296146 n=1 Tax=Anomaloglossus baeobatrachus TaxID=238106 RepID=UPI003F50293B